MRLLVVAFEMALELDFLLLLAQSVYIFSGLQLQVGDLLI